MGPVTRTHRRVVNDPGIWGVSPPTLIPPHPPSPPVSHAASPDRSSASSPRGLVSRKPPLEEERPRGPRPDQELLAWRGLGPGDPNLRATRRRPDRTASTRLCMTGRRGGTPPTPPGRSTHRLRHSLLLHSSGAPTGLPASQGHARHAAPWTPPGEPSLLGQEGMQWAPSWGFLSRRNSASQLLCGPEPGTHVCICVCMDMGTYITSTHVILSNSNAEVTRSLPPTTQLPSGQKHGRGAIGDARGATCWFGDTPGSNRELCSPSGRVCVSTCTPRVARVTACSGHAHARTPPPQHPGPSPRRTGHVFPNEASAGLPSAFARFCYNICLAALK